MTQFPMSVLQERLFDQRKAAKKEEIFNAQTKVTLDNLFDQMKLGEIKELQIIVKADVQVLPRLLSSHLKAFK